MVDVHVESGGGKGWPSDVCTVFYHKQQVRLISQFRYHYFNI